MDAVVEEQRKIIITGRDAIFRLNPENRNKLSCGNNRLFA
jgi:hypothetical protein